MPNNQLSCRGVARDDRGIQTIEYALLAALIALVVLLAYPPVGKPVREMLERAVGKKNDKAQGCGGGNGGGGGFGCPHL
jgi:Flp pilus assembly pilin Flp